MLKIGVSNGAVITSWMYCATIKRVLSSHLFSWCWGRIGWTILCRWKLGLVVLTNAFCCMILLTMEPPSEKRQTQYAILHWREFCWMRVWLDFSRGEQWMYCYGSYSVSAMSNSPLSRSCDSLCSTAIAMFSSKNCFLSHISLFSLETPSLFRLSLSLARAPAAHALSRNDLSLPSADSYVSSSTVFIFNGIPPLYYFSVLCHCCAWSSYMSLSGLGEGSSKRSRILSQYAL